MNEKTKLCPMCAEEIPLESEVCGYCGARFKIISTGYCRSCHNMRGADNHGHCSVCGEALQDWHVESRLAEEDHPAPSTPAPQVKPVEESTYTLEILPLKGENVLNRFSALFDDMILIAIFFGLFVVFFSGVIEGLDLPDRNSWRTIFSGNLLIAGPLIWFLYFFVFEGALGTTPGKALNKIRVIKKEGGRLNWGQAAIRAIFSLFEDNLIGGIIIMATPHNQRLGDLVAGTLVVNKKKLYQVEMAPPKLVLVFHDLRRVTFNKLLGGTIGYFAANRRLSLVGESDENKPIQVKLNGAYFLSKFELLSLNLQERYHLVFPKKLMVWNLVSSIFAILFIIGALIFGVMVLIGFDNLSMDRNPSSLSNVSESQPAATLNPVVRASPTPVPSSTQKPTATATPLPVEANFDTLVDFEDGELVIFVGRLAMMSSTICDYQCGLLLENPSNTYQKITLFVLVGDNSNQMKALGDNYTKGDIQIQLDDGSYAYVGYRLQVTGRKCTTTEGNPCISSIQKIEFYKIP